MNYSIAATEVLDAVLKTLSVKISLTDSDTNDDLKSMLMQLNRVYRKIFTQYVDVKRRAEVAFTEGRAAFSAIAEELLGENAKIINVEKVEKKGETFPFEERNGSLICPDAGERAVVTATVLYDKNFGVTDTVPLPNVAFAQVLIDGTAAEFAAVRGMPQEAAYYKSCFESGIFNLTRDRKMRRFPARGFV